MIVHTNFKRKIEDFKCENCGTAVSGNGYTNHCPNCLYSKHVDEFTPGDRKSNCQGMMEPTGVIKQNGLWKIIHKCNKCQKVSRCKTSDLDNYELLISLSTQSRV